MCRIASIPFLSGHKCPEDSNRVGVFRQLHTGGTVLSAFSIRSIPNTRCAGLKTSTVQEIIAVTDSQVLHSEKALIASARAGNRNAFGELVRRHSHKVYGMSFKILKNREDAEDNLQNVFCKAYGKIRQFEGNSQFSTWLIRIAINEALMMLRKRRPEQVAAVADGDEPLEDYETKTEVRDLRADPERQYLTKELATKALDTLHPTLKYTFMLQKGEGWTSRELAQALDITPEIVKSRIFRARVRLRQRLVALAKPAEPMALQS
jgi:RNA polymerase sigma-70 factor, ECF subfamily